MAVAGQAVNNKDDVLKAVVVSNEYTTSLLYLSTFFKYLYFTGVVLFWVTFTFTSLQSKA